MKPVRCAVLLGCAVAVAASLSACREEEQGRILLYQKGVYLGKADTGLSEQARRAIRLRTRYQGESVSAGGGGSARRANIRPPADAVRTGASEERLRQRARRQGFN